MSNDELVMSRIDEALGVQPMWEPPRGFAARVAITPPMPAPEPGFFSLSTLAYGTGVSLLGIAGGFAVADVYERFAGKAANALVMNPTGVAWFCVVLLALTAYLFPSIWSPESDSV